VRFGLFLRNLDEEFQITVFRGIRERARERGVDLVCVQGETIRGKGQNEDRPFWLAKAVRFDGILVLSSVIVDHNEHSTDAYLSSLFPPVPCVSVGRKIRGVASVSIKNRRSMQRIVEHLVLDHGYRRFLFICGPRGHRDSREREHVFRQTLAAFQNSHPDIEWIEEYGGFSESSAKAIVKRYLSEKPFHAIVAANDNMALGALKELKLHDDPAWRECAVTGFDDIPQAALEIPALTSVHQPLEELGAQAVDRLLELVARRGPSMHSAIQSWPVIRESCGCSHSLDGASLFSWPGEVAAIKSKLHQVQRLALESEQWLREGRTLGSALSAVTDLRSLLSLLDAFLSNLGVAFFSLIVLKDGAEGSKDGYLVYERVGGQVSPLPGEGVELELENFFSIHASRRGSPWDYCLAHLRSGAEQSGIALYSVEDWAQIHMASAMPHIANALKRLRVIAGQEDRNRELEVLVAARTLDLTTVNERLSEEIERRRKTEGEVLQVSEFERRRFGLDLHDDICQRLAGIVMYLKGSRVKTLGESRALLAEAANLVDETLSLTRQYAHASFPMDLERRGLDSVLRSLCESMSIRNGCVCEYSGELASVHPPMGPQSALNVYRIVQEALHNALKHAHASKIEVAVKVSERFCSVSVSDNGTGLQRTSQTEGGLGLRSMAYRASQLGAGFRIESEPGMGTSVILDVPR
jgi:DNA-binding LacI/PurR family transcriptional regulator/signal transduction histidine kinase